MKRNNAVQVVLVFCVVWLSAGGLYGASPEDFLDASRIAALRSGAKLSEIQFSNTAPLLAPRHEGVRLLIEDIRRNLEPGIMAESLYLYDKPEGASQTAWTAGEQLALLNEILALSSLAGLQYFSASRGTMRTFYETSVVIDGPSTKKPVSDPVYVQLPQELTLYAQQKDLTFGNNTYRYDYRIFSDSLVFVQQNLTSLSSGIITAVGKNKLHSLVSVIDAGDCLLIYAVSMAKASAFPGLKTRIGNSFSTRAEAVLTWFARQADRAFGQS